MLNWTRTLGPRISMLSGLCYFSLSATGQLLKGNFDCSATQELSKRLSPLTFLPLHTKTVQSQKLKPGLKRSSMPRWKIQCPFGITNRVSTHLTFQKWVVLSEWRHVIGLLTNIIKAIGALMKPAVPGIWNFPVKIACYRSIFHSINQSDFKVCRTTHVAEMPAFFFYIFMQLQAIWMYSAGAAMHHHNITCTENKNIKNLILHENKSMVDLTINCIQEVDHFKSTSSPCMIIPKITPLHLYPITKKEKKIEELTALLVAKAETSAAQVKASSVDTHPPRNQN